MSCSCTWQYRFRFRRFQFSSTKNQSAFSLPFHFLFIYLLNLLQWEVSCGCAKNFLNFETKLLVTAFLSVERKCCKMIQNATYRCEFYLKMSFKNGKLHRKTNLCRFVVRLTMKLLEPIVLVIRLLPVVQYLIYNNWFLFTQLWHLSSVN